MTGTASAHHRGAPATQVFTVPNMNYRQHQRNQADGLLAALALRALGICRDSRVHATHRAGALGVVFCSERRSPRGPIRRSMATIDSASRRLCDYAVCPRLLRRVKRRGWRKLSQHQRSDAAARVQSRPTQAFPSVTMDAKARAFLVCPHQPRITRHIGGEDCGKAPGLAQIASLAARADPGSAARELPDLGMLMRLHSRFGLVSLTG